MAKKEQKREAQLLSLKDPIAMTLAKRPANRAGFKIIRSDEEHSEDEKVKEASHHTPAERTRKKKNTIKRQEVALDNNKEELLYRIKLPAGISQLEAEQLRSAFGMDDDYAIEVDEDGVFFLVRTGAPALDQMSTLDVDMGNGFTATIDKAAFGTVERQDGQHGVKLVELQMDEFSLESAKDWLERHDVDFQEGGVEVLTEGGVIVKRHEHHEADVRKIRIGDGVTGVVVRAEENDVPAHLYRTVVESAYGSYGWGLLDFSQAVASPLYSETTWDGIAALRDVLESVALYSGLPLDERKKLVDDALISFGTYYKAIIEAMPREAVDAALRFNRNVQEADMAKKDQIEKVEERTEEQVAAAAAAEETTETVEARTDEVTTEETTEVTEEKTEERAEPEYVTKDELATVVADAVTAALTAREDKTEETAEAATEETTEERSDEETPSEADKKLAEGVTTLAEATAKLLERMDQLDTKLESYGENVEARSDEAGDEGTSEGGSKADVFDGMFGALQGLRVN